MSEHKIIRDEDDFDRIYRPKHYKQRLIDAMSPEEYGEYLAKEAIDKLRKDLGKDLEKALKK